MLPPAALIKRGITSLPCIGDGRQSGTSASPSIVNASPEAAVGGGLALVKTGDKTEAAGEPRLVQTVRGVGYVLRERR